MAERADDKGLFKRGRRWWLSIHVPGKGTQKIPLRPEGESLATANRDVARAIARMIRQSVSDGGGAKLAAVDMDGIIQQFQDANTIEASRNQAARNAGRVRAFVADKNIKHPSSITLESVQSWFADLLRDGAKPKTILNARGCLGRFCDFLVDRGLLESNPCHRVRIPRIQRLPPRFLSPAEYDKALALADKHGILPHVETALRTGMRREELRRLTWADVDFERAVVHVVEKASENGVYSPRSKRRRARAIPMSERLAVVLRKQQAESGHRTYVFPGENIKGTSGMRDAGWWSDALKPLQDAMPIFTRDMGDKSTGRAWHILRHTFASRLVQAGVPLAKVSAWMGHSDIRTTMIYAHLAPGHDADIEKA